jgi:hypothetical protein
MYINHFQGTATPYVKVPQSLQKNAIPATSSYPQVVSTDLYFSGSAKPTGKGIAIIAAGVLVLAQGGKSDTPPQVMPTTITCPTNTCIFKGIRVEGYTKYLNTKKGKAEVTQFIRDKKLKAGDTIRIRKSKKGEIKISVEQRQITVR